MRGSWEAARAGDIASIRAYFDRMGWFVLQGTGIHPDALPEYLCVCSVDGQGELDFSPFESAEALVRAWEHDACVHLRRAWTAAVIKALFVGAGDDGQWCIRNWIGTGGRFPETILAATAGWTRPDDWAEQVIGLNLPRMALLEGVRDWNEMRAGLAAWVIEHDRTTLWRALPQCVMAAVRNRI